MFTQSTLPPPPPPRPRKGGSWEVQARVAVTLALMFLSAAFVLAGVGSAAGLDHFSAKYDYRHRFSTDNAVGATANGVEYLARRSESQPALWFIAALLCWILISLGWLRDAVLQRET